MKDLLKITLLATSDVHGFYLPWDYSMDEETEIGGLSRISTIVKQIRKENPHTILIDNGDLIQGNSAEFFLSEAKYPGIEAINEMEYEIYNMGNHEFNFGMDTLIHVVGQFKGVAMMGNLYRKKNNMRFMNGIYYKNIAGIRIAFIGLNTPLVRHFEEKRGNLKNYDVTDADFELKNLLEEIDSADAIIGIFHMGEFNENDIPNTGITDLLANVPNANRIDAVISGHMHKVINTKIGQTYFLQPGVYAQALARYDLYFDLNKEKKLVKIVPEIINIDSTIESDKNMHELLKPYHIKIRNYINKIVGYVSEPLYDENIFDDIPQTRIAQTKISDFFLEVMHHYSKADVVAINLDAIDPGFKNQEVKRKDVFHSYRYSGGEITNYKIKGEDLRKYMEWSASYFNKFKETDKYISFKKERESFKYSTFDIFGNVKYEFDITQDDGQRLKNLRYMDDTEIKDEDDLVLGVNKYRMDFLTSDAGPLRGKKFEVLWSSMKDLNLDVRGNIRNLAIKYFDELKNKTYTPKNIERWHIKTF